MKRDEFLIRLDEIMNRAAGDTKADEVLADIDGWDSLAMLGFIALADADLAVRLTGKQLAAAKSVQDLIDAVAAKLEG